ncbi:MAG: hypothetical protein ABSH01_07075 [Terriglobia bacterium]|jgi:hypothetical protein
MLLQLVRKPPIGNARSDRLKVTLAGRHTMKQKLAMFTQVKFWLHHEQGIDNAAAIDFYIPLIDPDGHPLIAFRDGKTVSDYNLFIENPYPCAADEYDRRGPAPPVLRPF